MLLRRMPAWLPAGENWTDRYYYVTSLGVGAAPTLLILVFFAIGNFVLMALFVAVILENFETKDSEMESEQAEAYERLRKLVMGTVP